MKLDYLKDYNTEELKSEESESLIELEKTKKSLELKLTKLDRIKKLLIERGAETSQKTESDLPLHIVMPCIKGSLKELIDETKESYKLYRSSGMESTALTSEAMNYAYQISLNIVERYEA